MDWGALTYQPPSVLLLSWSREGFMHSFLAIAAIFGLLMNNASFGRRKGLFLRTDIGWNLCWLFYTCVIAFMPYTVDNDWYNYIMSAVTSNK